MKEMEKLIAEIMQQMAEDGTPVTKAEAEEMAKMEIGAKQIKRYESSGNKKVAKKPRKIDETKLFLFKKLVNSVSDFTDTPKCKNESEFSFTYENDNYTVKLIKHRPKK